jgi:hypothetical protein
MGEVALSMGEQSFSTTPPPSPLSNYLKDLEKIIL